MFEKATRLKLRFETVQGVLSIEDLWDLPLQTTRESRASLDSLAIALDRKLKDSATVSFVDDAPKANEELQLAFEIVKHVIDVKKAENEAARNARERAAKKERILEIIARKEDETLAASSIDELRAALATL